MEIILNKQKLNVPLDEVTSGNLKSHIGTMLGLLPTEFYLLSNGKIVHNVNAIVSGKIHVVPTVCGGKGGFGSMLRAIGAQIEKTTNREACRDLSGRRLRDINEEKKLKNWIATQAEREKEAAERKKKKLERLCQQPKHEFKDETYDKERSELPEIVEDAVTQGMKASCSTKRQNEAVEAPKPKKKKKLWVDADLEDELSSSDGSCDEEGEDKIVKGKEHPKKQQEIANLAFKEDEASSTSKEDEASSASKEDEASSASNEDEVSSAEASSASNKDKASSASKEDETSSASKEDEPNSAVKEDEAISRSKGDEVSQSNQESSIKHGNEGHQKN